MSEQNTDWSFIGLGYLLAITMMVAPFSSNAFPGVSNRLVLKVFYFLSGLLMMLGISVAVRQEVRE